MEPKQVVCRSAGAMQMPENAVMADSQISAEVLVYVDESVGSGVVAYGFVVKKGGETVARESVAFRMPYTPPACFATCRGILAALRWLLEHGVHGPRVRVISDNNIVDGMPDQRRQFRRTRESISEAADELKRRAQALGTDCEVTFERMPRALVAEADRLARTAFERMENPAVKKLEVV